MTGTGDATTLDVVRRRILFVDDEPNLLAGLRRMLRTKRDVWDMEFAEGAEAALDLMAEAAVDVVVSDMRMPGMDGAQLLAAVRRLHPRTARIILSGHADRASIISAVGPTQQYLAKPCEVDTLIAVLERVLALRDLVVDERLRTVLGGIDSLPKPPEIYERMLALSTDPECRIDDVVGLIERDVATTAEVLRLVNSAFFCLPTHVEDVGRAVHLLGLETVQALAIAGAVFGTGGPLPMDVDAHELSHRGLHVASLARRIATAEGWSRPAVGDAFFAGLLHEVGLLALASARPSTAPSTATSTSTSTSTTTTTVGLVPSPRPGAGQTRHEQETARYGCSATEASAYLLGLWGFGEPVIEAIAAQPADAADPAASPAALVLSAARHLVSWPGEPLQANESGYLTAERVATWSALARELRPVG